MSPTAEPANPPVTLDATSEKLLDEGEMIILTLKPSGWFVLLASWPILAVAAAIAVGTLVAGRFFAGLSTHMIYTICLAVASVRIVLACAQWVGRLYLLTTRRVMRVCGVTRAWVNEYSLRDIKKTTLSATSGEKLLGTGNLLFHDDQGRILPLSWMNIARPDEVQEIVEKAIRNCRRT